MMRWWLLVVAVVWAGPTPLCADPRPAPGQIDSLLPLAVGNTWTWHTNYGEMTQKVSRDEKISLPGAPITYDCAVVETTIESPDKVVQTEYYAHLEHDLDVVKRVYPGDETIMTPPEIVMRGPVVVGQQWEWDGDTHSGHAHLEFKVLRSDRLKVPALKTAVICQKIVMQGESQNGSSMTVTRWYAPGIGMVKENSVMTKGQQSIVVNGVLKSYHIEAPLKP